MKTKFFKSLNFFQSLFFFFFFFIWNPFCFRLKLIFIKFKKLSFKNFTNVLPKLLMKYQFLDLLHFMMNVIFMWINDFIFWIKCILFKDRFIFHKFDTCWFPFDRYFRHWVDHPVLNAEYHFKSAICRIFVRFRKKLLKIEVVNKNAVPSFGGIQPFWEYEKEIVIKL